MPGCRRKALRYRLLCSVCRSSLGLVDALCPIDLQLWNAEFCPRPTTGGQVAAGHGIDAGGEAGNGASPGQEERLAQISAMKKKELTAELARLGLETIKKEKDADTRQRLVDHLNASNAPPSEGAPDVDPAALLASLDVPSPSVPPMSDPSAGVSEEGAALPPPVFGVSL